MPSRLPILLALIAAPALADEGRDPPPAPAPVARDVSGTSYGGLVPADAAPIAIDAAARDVARFGGAPHAFRGRITEVCQKQGCWLVLEAGGEFARVLAHEHAFSVPKGAKGEAVVYGTLTIEPLSDAEEKHLASDGAKHTAKRELRIDATAVRLLGAG